MHIVAAPAVFAPMAGARSPRLQVIADIPPFITWLRQVRRSAWVLIALCSIFRIGDALINDPTLSFGTAAAVAAEVR